MNIGQRIKRFRNMRGMTQKKLAEITGMSEPAIRNYELGNRTPSDSHLERIANALDINLLAICNPIIDTYDGLMHALFCVEDIFGLDIKKINGQYAIFINNETLLKAMGLWHIKNQSLKNGQISIKEYDEWRFNFPKRM